MIEIFQVFIWNQENTNVNQNDRNIWKKVSVSLNGH